MAAVSLLGSTFTTTSGAKSVTATPAVGDLILIFVQVSDDSTWSAPTDDNTGGTYTLVRAMGTGVGGVYVRDNLVSSASSTVFTLSNPGSDTGGGLAIVKVTGMDVAGSAAIRQIDYGALNGGTTPTTSGTWPSNKVISNPVIGFLINSTNPAGVTVTTGYTELLNTGYATPDTGLEIQYVNSGDNTDTLTMGGNSASFWYFLGVELDAPPTNGNMFLMF